MEETIVLSSSELVDYTILTKQKNELAFKKDFLLSKGLNENSEAVIALNNQIQEIDSKLDKIIQKIKSLDLVLIIPNKAEIDALTTKISTYSKAALEEALKSKNGPIYDLLRERAKYSKFNFLNKEVIARLIILANMLPKNEAEKLAAVLEAKIFDVVDVSSLDQEKQKEILQNLTRLKIYATISNNLLTFKKEEQALQELQIKEQVQKIWPENSKPVWILKENEQKWDEKESEFKNVWTRLQVLITKNQVEKLNDEELAEFDELQNKYLTLKNELKSLTVEENEQELKLIGHKNIPKPNPPASAL